MSDAKLAATARTEFGKGAARRVRRAGQVPAVVYGHGTEPQHIALPGHDTMMALKVANALLTITLDGADDILALVKDVQRDPIKRTIDHVDLVIVRRGEKVVVDVAVHVEGEAAPETVVNLELVDVPLEVEATDIPESVVVSVEGLTAGTQILAKDLNLPKGAALAIDEEHLIVNVTQVISQEALDAELAESPAGEAEAAAQAEPAGDED